MVFAPRTDVKHCVFCFRKLPQMNTSEKITPGQLQLSKTGSSVMTFSQETFYIFLKFDVLIQRSLQGGNRHGNTLTGGMDGDSHETGALLSFPTAVAKASSGFTTMPAPTSSASRAERVSLFKWMK